MVRIFGKTRRTRSVALASLAALLAVMIALPASAGPVGVAAGFEDDDGNLVDNTDTATSAGIDWNSFDPVVWSPHPSTTPNRQTDDKTVSSFKFKGLEDWQATTADSGFAGGTKQDDNCPTVITAKAPNKDDLKRVYLASKTGSDGHTYLELAWVRIPQNTTSPSAHIGFEFNKGNATPTPGCAGPGGLVNRVAGDMLIVYDFEGGSTDVPTITLRRWTTSGACEVSSNSAPCWGVAANLTATGFAEAKVNVGATALDALTSPALSSTTGVSVDSTLGASEFGEAGIDLTGAGVFTSGVCNSFGKVYAVSRSSGNSGTAQMKDLVGPANFSLSNCGAVTIIKRTSPRGENQDFGFTSNLSGTCTADSTPAAFTLNDNGNTTSDSTANTESCIDVPAGNYTVTEGANPTGFEFTDLSCTATGSGTSATPTSGNSTKTATITVAGGGSVTCVYTNTLLLGGVKVVKTAKHADTSGDTSADLAANFTITDSNGDTHNVATDGTTGLACVDNLPLGAATVDEVAPFPAGYQPDPDVVNVTVTGADCADAGVASASFENIPLTDVQIVVDSQHDGGTSTLIECWKGTSDPTTDPADYSKTVSDGSLDIGDLLPTDPAITLNCAITIDP